ncbi:MAG: hypothetical protein ACLQU2_11715 [Candidatus Binataceae bacterium]
MAIPGRIAEFRAKTKIKPPLTINSVGLYSVHGTTVPEAGSLGRIAELQRHILPSISLKLPQALLETSDRCARALGIPRAKYIRRAIERMNREALDRTRAQRIADASRKVPKE